MKDYILITGGAGFIGRCLSKKLLEKGQNIVILDNLSNSRIENISEFIHHSNLIEWVHGDIQNRELVHQLFNTYQFSHVFHLAASINVQESIDHPEDTFKNDVIGTFNVLEEARALNSRFLFMSTCMVYDQASEITGIAETHLVKPASPYAGSKLAGENLVQSYFHAYGMPTTIVRPFNTYGPFQKSNLEGGVVMIFIQKSLEGNPLLIFGEGTQTRDLLYVEDCAEFLLACTATDATIGHVVNAGLGQDISVNDLALLIAKDPAKIQHIPHHHPQAEIQKLLCNNEKAHQLLGWTPHYTLEKGIEKTRQWLRAQYL